ncbi:MAG: GNAT family protein [Chitinophagaceae bacterium]
MPLNYNNKMTLHNGDVLLRPLRDADKTAIAILLNNENVWNNVRDMIPFPYTETDAQIFIDLKKEENPPFTFAIEYNGEFCGIIGLVPQNDVYKLSAEIGYWIGERFWGNGITTKAVHLITTYGLEELSFIRIYAGVFEFNIRSMRVLEKSGFQKDGIFRKAVIKNDKIWDEHRYSITK